MDIFSDILEYLPFAIWLIIIFFGSKIFGKKEKKEKQHEYPEFPDDNSTIDMNANDQLAEERRLKEWLDNVFGPLQPESKTEKLESEVSLNNQNTQIIYKEDGGTVMEPVYMDTDPLYKEQTFSVNLNKPSEEIKVIVSEHVENPWEGKIDKRKMAYGMVMAEIFAKPRSMNPLRPVTFSQKEHKK